MFNLKSEGEKVIQENSKSAVISKRICSLLILLILLVCMNTLSGCASDNTSGDESGTKQETVTEYSYQEYPLMRNNIDLHLDCVSVEKTQPEKSILLVHGATYSSHEFDIDFEDYSLVKRLADEGYAVWRIDIAGYGRSEKVKNGFMPDTDYAAKDINAAVKKIVSVTGEDKIDVLGWSWGTMTAGRFAGKYPEHLQRLVLYAPVLTGIGEAEVTEKFHHNTWESAAEDFQRDEEGNIDESITDPQVVAVFCSNCWRYDGNRSPNAWRLDALVSEEKELINLKKITVPTLLICGDQDPYLNYDAVNGAIDQLPEGSKLEVIPGGAHAIIMEAPYHLDFQNRIVDFLLK